MTTYPETYWPEGCCRHSDPTCGGENCPPLDFNDAPGGPTAPALLAERDALRAQVAELALALSTLTEHLGDEWENTDAPIQGMIEAARAALARVTA